MMDGGRHALGHLRCIGGFDRNPPVLMARQEEYLLWLAHERPQPSSKELFGLHLYVQLPLQRRHRVLHEAKGEETPQPILVNPFLYSIQPANRTEQQPLGV